ncbi:MAG TPA: CoA transferase [Acidimicrobiales bacterium]|nr:CoA transferase [Acidimicrobiales bacterium]
MLPLDGVRVVDAVEEKGELCGRLLADLGAEVVRVGPVTDQFRNINKVGAPPEAVDALLAGADVFLTSKPPTSTVMQENPHLIVTAITDFGLTGPYRDYVATNAVMVAMGGMLFRSGTPDQPPLLPPGTLAYDVAGVSAAMATLTAVWQRRPQLIDASVMESLLQITDWSLAGYAIDGGMDPMRAGSGPVYSIYPCADGYVRVIVLSPRQWAAMRDWLGNPPELEGPEKNGLLGRLGIQTTVIDPLYLELFSKYGAAELADEAQRRGIVITPVLRPDQVLTTPHFVERGTFVDGCGGRVASGLFEMDGERVGVREEYQDGAAPAWEPRPAPGAVDLEPARPFAGLRVIDFGIGAVGVEVGRYFAENGADVIKVESRTYPDFIRVVLGTEMNFSFASSSRCKRGFGVNVKTPEGLEFVKTLLADADVLIENSATGVMDDLGLGWSAVHEINPRLVMVSSQLMGSTGPWKDWIGYGPSTRPPAGMTHLWNWPDGGPPPGSFAVHPDHLVGRVCTVGALAALIGGGGRHVECAQVETIINFLGDILLRESIEPGSAQPLGNGGTRVVKCAGNERWVVIDGDCDVTDEWCAERTDRDVVAELQARGAAAGYVVYPSDMATDPHLVARGYAQQVDQPGAGRMYLEGPAFHATGIPEPIVAPAPGLGEHTREIARDLLSLSDSEIDKALAAGILEGPLTPT